MDSLLRTRSSAPSPDLHLPISASFSSLPLEIRQMIWLGCLDKRPRVYTFDLAVRDERGMPCGSSYSHENITAIHPVFEVYYTEERDLITGSADRRTLSAICAESRKIVLQVFPDILRFEVRRKFVMGSNNGAANGIARVGFCRYNSKVEVICLRLYRDHLYLFPKVMAMTSNPFPAFEAVQNLALVYETDNEDILSLEYAQYSINVPHNPDACGCLDGLRFTTCREDLLPKFVRCFPSLKKLIINDISSPPCEYYWDETQVIRYTGCRCFPDHGDSSSASPAKKHDVWQLVPIHAHQSHRQASACVAVVYDERTACAGLNLGPLRFWDNIETSYKPPERLVMRFLHPRDAQGRWEQPHIIIGHTLSKSPPYAFEYVAE
ncbi:hypothetical protein PspLS_06380 [Pyricularia sp. CBS 133598]|nr:hypothetical protein PspLS_06380 [Pyricularia sp. CBS 133598]